ncbi:MAG TPA: hypothetical protein VES66_10275 [Terriglobales bacterium]|nr:hypothetical protein [Terriglobales bacterium]
MPLARIITRTPEDAEAVSDYLLSRGYTVETVSPEEFRITPAELELKLEKCRPGQALARAKALVESQSGAAIELAAVPELAPPQKPKIPIAYDIAGRPVEFADEEEFDRRQKSNGIGRALASLLSRLTTPVRDSQQRRAEQRALKLEVELAREREEIKREEELARERVRQEMERQRQEAELAERRRQEQVAAEQQAERRRQKQIAALQAAGITVEPETAPQQGQPVNPPEPAQGAPRQQIPTARPGRGADRRMGPPVRRRRAPIPISGKALAIGCVAGLLVVLGLAAFNNRRPASPLSPGALMKDGSMKQDVPFGTATITPPKPSPVTTAKSSPGIRPANRKPSASHPRRASQGNRDGAVVRDLHTPPAQPQPSTAKLKQHPDVE